ARQTGGWTASTAFHPGAWRWTTWRGGGLVTSRWGSLATTGWPVAEREGPTTQLLLPASPSSVPSVPAAPADSYWRTSSGTAWLPSRTLSITSSVIAAGSNPFGTTSGSGGSGFAAALAAAAPSRATSLASGSSAAASPNVGVRSTSCSIVHGSGTIPVTTNSIGRRSLCCAMNALTPFT